MTDSIAALIDQNHKHLETIEALQNLLYLIKLDSAHMERVNAYVKQAERVMARKNGCVVIN